jgi:hypothetical protein
MAKIPGACNHTGKCSNQELLPSRHALTSLTQGDPMSRTLNNYAKATPTGANTPLSPTALTKFGVTPGRARNNF